MKTNWLILGASSPIAKAFIEKAASSSRRFILVGRDSEDLNLTAQHIQIKYHVNCEVIALDLQPPASHKLIADRIQKSRHNLSLFIAHTYMSDNDKLDDIKIEKSIQVNVAATCQVIHAFVTQARSPKSIIYLSSVAGVRGRYANSLYGATKKTVETYLEGIKVAHPNIHIAAVRLGFIDTSSTYGKPGIFLAKTPEQCASFCYQLYSKRKTAKYFPWFWRYIMTTIKLLPDKIYNQLKI